jgi:hypothetical protein
MYNVQKTLRINCFDWVLYVAEIMYKAAAKAFAEYWKAKGYEKGESQNLGFTASRYLRDRAPRIVYLL